MTTGRRLGRGDVESLSEVEKVQAGGGRQEPTAGIEQEAAKQGREDGRLGDQHDAALGCEPAGHMPADSGQARGPRLVDGRRRDQHRLLGQARAEEANARQMRRHDEHDSRGVIRRPE